MSLLLSHSETVAPFAIALALTIASALLAAAMAGYRAARIEPSEGLREI